MKLSCNYYSNKTKILIVRHIYILTSMQGGIKMWLRQEGTRGSNHSEQVWWIKTANSHSSQQQFFTSWCLHIPHDQKKMKMQTLTTKTGNPSNNWWEQDKKISESRSGKVHLGLGKSNWKPRWKLKWGP